LRRVCHALCMRVQSTNSKMKILNIIAGVLIAGVAVNSFASHGESKPGERNSSGTASAGCSDINQLPKLACAPAPSSVFSDSGRLWVAWSYAGHVYVSYSDDKARTFSLPVSVNSVPEKISARGENRPKIALNNKGAIYVSWTTPLKKRFSGNVRFSYSNDNAKSFSQPVTVNDNLDITGHRFEALTVADNGNIYLAWLDKRDRFKAEKAAKKYHGAALYYSWSDNGGKSFHSNQKIIDHSCECCRVAIDTDNKNLPVILWRNIYDKNTRDHTLVNFNAPGFPAEPVRVSFDNWQVDACPHHGPDLSISRKTNDYHLVWFDNAVKRHGLFYMRMNNKNKQSTPLKFGNYKAAASHPSVLSKGNKVWLSWKEFDGKKASLWSQFSTDNGDSWSKAKPLAETTAGSDYAFLLMDTNRVYIQWKTTQEGFQLIALDESGTKVGQ